MCNRIAFIVDGKIVKIDSTEKLLETAQREKIVQFSVDNCILELQGILQQTFPEYKYKVIDEQTIRVYSAEAIDLIPIIEVFKDNSLTLYEAKVIKPSLEEVFVKITGIEAKKMKNEGGKK